MIYYYRHSLQYYFLYTEQIFKDAVKSCPGIKVEFLIKEKDDSNLVEHLDRIKKEIGSVKNKTNK